MKKVYAKYGDKVDIAVVEDLAKGDFTDALGSVSAVIHAATPLPGRGELKSVLEVGYLPSRFSGSNVPQRSSEHQGGALNIVRQAVAVCVKHVSFVGTVGAVIGLADPLVKAPLSDEDWNPLTEEFA